MKCNITLIFLVLSFCLVVGEDKIKKKTINIATEEYPPFTSKSLKHKGIDCHIVEKAFESQGIAVKFEFLPGARSFELAKNGEKDATLPWAKRKPREEDFLYSDPVIEVDREYFYHLKSYEFKWDFEKQDYEKLKGLRVGAIIAFNYDTNFQEAEKNGTIKVVRLKKLKQAYEMLFAGRLDLVITKESVGEYALLEDFTKEQIQKIGKVKENNNKVKFDYLLISKKSNNSDYFFKAFNLGLKQLKDSGEYDKMMQEHKKGSYLKKKVEPKK